MNIEDRLTLLTRV